jgi:hypothetical protein
MPTRLAGRPKIRLENDVEEDLRIMRINKCTKCVQNRVIWREVVEKATTCEVVAPDEEERLSCADGVSNQAGCFVLVGPPTLLVAAACSAIKRRACKLAGKIGSVLAGPSFFLLTVLVFRQIFLLCFCINHRDVYRQRMFYIYNGCLAEHSHQDHTFYFELA